jgi:hypothetical protein
MTAHEIERAGTELLKRYLEKRGRVVETSDRKTFDLKVDGKYAEVKAKGKSFDCFDFLVLSDKQYEALTHGEDFIVFLVLGVCEPERLRVVEIPAAALLSTEPKIWKQYFWDKGMLDSLWKREHGESLRAICERPDQDIPGAQPEV